MNNRASEALTPAAKADLLRSLHLDGPPLLLANAWDVASAAVIAATGAPAVATTSAGVAWSLGIPDGNVLGRRLAVELIARVVRAVEVPVTADIEGGFADDPAGVGETIHAVVDAGAVGINIEDVAPGRDDALRPTDDQARRVEAARIAAAADGVRLFINARVDTYLRLVGDPAGRLDETAVRAQAYLAAGADGIFVPGVVDPDTIRQLVSAIPAPLNILVGPGGPTVSKLEELGVRRVSLGSSVAAAAYAVADRAARELAGSGTYESVRSELPYPTLNELVS
jgi:2-methylisocitrate lyase-like PEP mutase family enzyme